MGVAEELSIDSDALVGSIGSTCGHVAPLHSSFETSNFYNRKVVLSPVARVAIAHGDRSHQKRAPVNLQQQDDEPW